MDDEFRKIPRARPSWHRDMSIGLGTVWLTQISLWSAESQELFHDKGLQSGTTEFALTRKLVDAGILLSGCQSAVLGWK